MSESTALTVIERAQVALQPAANEQQLTELAAASKSITAITNPAGRDQCHSARMSLARARIAIEKTGKAAREDATAFSKAVIAEEKRLIALIQPEEQRLETLQDAWDAARAAEKKAREEADRTRLAEIQRRLVKLESLGSGEIYTSAMAPERLQDILQQLEAPPVFDYAECGEQATALRQRAIIAIRQAHVEALERIERENAERVAREAEESRRAAERAEEARIAAEARAAEEARLAEVRRRLDEEKAEQERQAAERRAADEQRAREERERLEAERAVAELNQGRMSEIQGIQQQVIIATCGRAGVRRGGTRECILDTLEETRAWPVTEEHFGPVFCGAAQQAKREAVAQIEQTLLQWDADQAERDRIATQRAELERQQQEQAERQAEIERKEREAREAEEMRRAMAVVEEANRAAEAARAREAEERAAALRKRIASLTAEEIARIVANAIGCRKDEIAERIAAIEHEDWVALAMSDEQEEAA